MIQKLVLILAVAALILSAGTPTPVSHYRISLVEPAAVGSTTLPAGDYRLNLADTKVTFVPAIGKKTAEATVKIETQTAKFSDTVVELDKSSGKAVISEIRLGGTKTKLVLQ